jgi:2-C-methyl-D-erythritol 4-phosphate cytidylyltransferase
MNAAVILSAGTGKRFDMDIPKQFIEINSKPLLVYTVEAFEKSSCIDLIIISINKNMKKKTLSILKKYKFKKNIKVIEGGKTRQESSYNALKYLDKYDPKIVVIHDAVRPFLTQKIIKDSVNAARKYGAVDVVIPATDTIVNAVHGFIADIPDRNRLYYGQTPQSFDYRLILEAHEKANNEGYNISTDDAKLALRAGHKVKIIKGNSFNIKLTNKFDLIFFQALFDMYSKK